jgi:uncharacterized protein YjbI with pentapeptide repeats
MYSTDAVAFHIHPSSILDPPGISVRRMIFGYPYNYQPPTFTSMKNRKMPDGKILQDIDLTTFRLEDKDKKDVPFERDDGTFTTHVFSGVPVTWGEFYETKNYKTKRLTYTSIYTDVASHLFSEWDLEGSTLPLVGNLTDAIVTKCCLYVPVKVKKNSADNEDKYEIDEKLAVKAFDIFASTRNYKDDYLNGIYLVGVDLRNGDFAGKNVSKMVFKNCKFFDSTHDCKFLFYDAVISGHNYLAMLPEGMSKEQFYQTKCYKNKSLRNIRFEYLQELDLSGQNLAGSKFYSLTGNKFDDAIFERTHLISITKEQLYTTKWSCASINGAPRCK